MTPPMDCRLVGRWRIVEADLWDRDYLDLVSPATMTIGADGHGEIAYGAMQASLELEYSRSTVFFTWAGFDEGDEITGSGSAELNDDGTIEIAFAYHLGDRAVLKAERMTSSTACYWWQEVEGFAEVFYRPKPRQAQTDQARLHAFVDPAVSRFKDEPNEERREAFRSLLVGYLRMYALLSQMVDYLGPDFEKLYSFGRLLRTKLPRREREGELELDGDVALAYYRLTITSEGDRALQPGDQEPITGAAEVGTSRPKDDQRSPLSEIISTINDRFGTDWKSEDRLLFDQVVEDLTQDDELGEQARANDLDNFKHVFDPKALDAFIQRMDRNNGIASQVLNNRQMLKAIMAAMMREVYDRAREAESAMTPTRSTRR